MKQLRIHYFQHVTFEGLGYIETWANQNNYTLTSTKFFESYQFPELDDFDWLLVMGGPMGVYDTDKYTWLIDEKTFIKSCIEANKTVIGICLGAQLIASSLGAKVYPNKVKEIGWFPIHKTNLGKQANILNKLPNKFTTFHWHGDTFDLPEGSIHIFQSDYCKNQGFLYNGKVLALQFHFEVTPPNIQEIINNCKLEITECKKIQSESSMLSSFNCQNNDYLKKILEGLLNT